MLLSNCPNTTANSECDDGVGEGEQKGCSGVLARTCSKISSGMSAAARARLCVPCCRRPARPISCSCDVWALLALASCRVVCVPTGRAGRPGWASGWGWLSQPRSAAAAALASSSPSLALPVRTSTALPASQSARRHRPRPERAGGSTRAAWQPRGAAEKGAQVHSTEAVLVARCSGEGELSWWVHKAHQSEVHAKIKAH